MKYLFLILLIPTLSHANFQKENGNVTYWLKADCEKTEGEKCYKLPPQPEVASLKEVEVDDPEKPIIEESEPVIVPNPETGEDELRCEAPKELNEDGKCREVVGYEKKLEKQFVVDPVKVKAKEDEKAALEAKAQACEQFRALLDDSAIDDKSTLKDVTEVTRRLLGFYKECSK